jgi:FixJ family two-component response regulator
MAVRAGDKCEALKASSILVCVAATVPPDTIEKQTVFVVDDDKHVRESLCLLLESRGYRVASFADGESFLRFYQREMAGCLILDVCMPRLSGLQLYERMLRERKRIPVIFVTAHPNVSTAVAAMKAGAIEFLEKPFDCAILVDRVETALAIDAKWRASERAFAALADRVARLTVRDRETLALIRQGLTNKAIAKRLRLTERAVEMRRSTIMRKLRVRTVAELIELTSTHYLLAELRSAGDDSLG